MINPKCSIQILSFTHPRPPMLNFFVFVSFAFEFVVNGVAADAHTKKNALLPYA